MLKVEIKNGKIYSFIRDKWLVCTPEEEVRQGFIHTLINKFGYLPDQIAEEVQVNNSQRGQGQARADIVVWKSVEDKINNKSAFIVVECKAENVKIHEEDYYQGYNYASWAGASFFVTTNNRETKYFNVDKTMMPKRLEEIVTIPTAEEADNERRVKEILSQTKTFSREEFTTMLLKCHNIIRNNDKLSPEAAFDEISKILFIKINYEREQKGKEIFRVEEYERREALHEKEIRPNLRGTSKDLPYMQFMFLNTKEQFKNDHLFEENEIIKIRETSFKSILKLLEKYNLSDTSDDVKGIAFEQFLGRTFRGELGQFFTPRTIVDFMTEILDPQEGELVCDPCCGSGGFLIKAFDYIREKIEKDIQEKKDKFKAELTAQYPENRTEAQDIELNSKIDKVFQQLNKELEHIHLNNPSEYSRLDVLSYKSIFGTDANPRMARISKMNMIMHGDGHGGVHHHDGLININGIFEGRFDVILTNPPFGASVGKDQYIEIDDVENDAKRIAYYKNLYGEEYEKQLKELQRIAKIVPGEDKKLKKEKSLLNFYETGKMSALTEVLFIERCIRLLKPGGRMGIVLPEGVLNNSNLQKVREYFEGKAKIILICSIPQDVFIKAGATVKPSLVFLKKFTEEESKQYNGIVEKARLTVDEKYIGEIQAIEDEYNAKLITKAIYNARMKQIELKKQEEIKPIVKEWFDYQIPIAKVEKAGITTTGAPCENELNDVLAEYRAYNTKNPLWGGIKNNKYLPHEDLNNRFLYEISYKDFGVWDVKRYNKLLFDSVYPIEPLGKHINSETEKLVLSEQPEVMFDILGVTNEEGIFDAYSAQGNTFNQPYKVMKRDFIAYNPYRVNIGSIGIKKEQKGWLISPAYVVISCKESLLPDYLFMLMKTSIFNKLIKQNTSGSVRQNLTFDALAGIKIPVPTIEEQKRLLLRTEALYEQKRELEKQIKEAKKDFENAIFGE